MSLLGCPGTVWAAQRRQNFPTIGTVCSNVMTVCSNPSTVCSVVPPVWYNQCTSIGWGMDDFSAWGLIHSFSVCCIMYQYVPLIGTILVHVLEHTYLFKRNRLCETLDHTVIVKQPLGGKIVHSLAQTGYQNGTCLQVSISHDVHCSSIDWNILLFRLDQTHTHDQPVSGLLVQGLEQTVTINGTYRCTTA
jgi:hypothetical protein